MAIVAMFVAVLVVGMLIVWRIVDLLRVESRNWSAPSSFTWKTRPFKVASWRALSGESFTKTSSLPAPAPAATQPLAVITGMDQSVGQTMPDVFIDVGIWCNPD